ncbi:MAG: cell division protein ZipA [Sneathiella sp.]|nr:MAG: cell division protein ZipA [Sneathiella sp.]
MSVNPPTLYLVCGKIAAGKSTLCRQLANAPKTILLSEDKWLATLYPDAITSLADYVEHASRLKAVIGEHIVSLLQAGVSVALDYPANTVQQRVWMKGLGDIADVGHELHYLEVPGALCKARLKKRNDTGSHEFTASEAEFDLISSYFVPPSADEGLKIIHHLQG